MVFGYYLPGVTEAALTADVLREAGLGDRFADIIATGDLEARLGLCEVHAKGPDGMSGLLITPIPLHGDVAPLRWKSEQQDAIDCGGFWLVADREKRPTPTGLERLSLIDGYAHRLGDGQVWQCPVISQALEAVHLPRQYSFVDGNWYGVVTPQYTRVWSASQVWSTRLCPEFADYSWEQLIGPREACEAAVMALAVNYRVGAEELTYLGAITTESVSSVLDSAIDKPHFEFSSGKKKAATLERLQSLRSLLLGAEGSAPDTDQAEQTSNSFAADMAESEFSTSPSP